MVEQWFAVVNALDGSLYSVGSVLTDVVPKEFTVLKIPAQLDQDVTAEWDQVQRTYVSVATKTPIPGIIVV